MTKDELVNKYFEWMYQLVCSHRYRGKTVYRKLLCYLHTVKYQHILPMDENRELDGIDLRYRFGYERGYSNSMISEIMGAEPCSLFEMMIALSLRCEETIMDDYTRGNRLPKWFWGMIDNLGLSPMKNVDYDKDYVEAMVSTFLNRAYVANGKGGLFTLRRCSKDMRTVEIWYQMCWYLDEIINDE